MAITAVKDYDEALRFALRLPYGSACTGFTLLLLSPLADGSARRWKSRKAGALFNPIFHLCNWDLYVFSRISPSM
jgi:hypothetical protein